MLLSNTGTHIFTTNAHHIDFSLRQFYKAVFIRNISNKLFILKISCFKLEYFKTRVSNRIEEVCTDSTKHRVFIRSISNISGK